MNSKPLTVSLSPHVYGSSSVKKLMYSVIIALMPALAVSFFIFGIRAILVVFVAVISAVGFEYLIQRFILKIPTTVSDGSAIITGILLAYNLPSNIPWGLIALGSFVAIAVAKMSFGGLGKNPFNPALVGRAFLLVSFPVALTSWPKPLLHRLSLADGITAATPLGLVKEGIKAGQNFTEILPQLPTYWDLFMGKMGGCIGEVSAFALLIGFAYLLFKKVITWHIPATMVGSIFALSGIFWLSNSSQYPDPLFHILTGGVMLGAIFMATDYVTSPMTIKGMVIYGVAIGILTVVIRLFGAYPEGVSFAILIMNAFVPIINRYCKPYRFGEGKKIA